MKPVNIAPRTYGKPEEIVFSVPERITNATTEGRYSQQQEWKNAAQRPGCQDFLKCKSRGAGC